MIEGRRVIRIIGSPGIEGEGREREREGEVPSQLCIEVVVGIMD